MNCKNELKIKPKKKYAKPRLVMIVALLLIVSSVFCGCNSDKSKETETIATTVVQKTSELFTEIIIPEQESTTETTTENTTQEPTTSLFDYYDSRLIKESRFETIEELTNYYLEYWEKHNEGRTVLEVIDGVDFYDDEICTAAAVQYLIQNEKSVDDFYSEYIHLQVCHHSPYGEYLPVDELKTLYDWFPEDANKYMIAKSYMRLAKEVIVLNELDKGNPVIAFELNGCITKEIARTAYDTFDIYGPIQKYFDI